MPKSALPLHWREQLHTALGQSLQLSERQCECIECHLQRLHQYNKLLNLTRIDEQNWLTHHVIDSLSLFAVMQHKHSVAPLHHANHFCIADVGSGAGFPGIPLAIAMSDVMVHLIESNHKKCTFLQQVIIDLGLNNLRTHCRRVQDITQQFDTVVTRATFQPQTLLKLTLPLIKPGGHLLAMLSESQYQQFHQHEPITAPYDEIHTNTATTPSVEWHQPSLPEQLGNRYILAVTKPATALSKEPPKDGNLT